MNINLTILGQAIAFAVFVIFCMKYVWPPLITSLRERQKKIAEGLESASRAEKDLELAKAKVTDQLREAKEEATQIIDGANKRADQIISEAKEQAGEERKRIIDAAQSDIDQEISRAREELRAQVSALAVTGAEKILSQSVNKEAHDEMLSQLAQEL